MSKGSLIHIGEGRSLILDGPTLVGIPDNNSSLVNVEGEFIMENGAIINNKKKEGIAGGVWVKDKALFIMNGGS